MGSTTPGNRLLERDGSRCGNGSTADVGLLGFIDGACEVNGQVEVFVSNVEDARCSGQFQVVTYPADAVRLPQTNMPIVFRETQIGCKQWLDQFLGLPRGTGYKD